MRPLRIGCVQYLNARPLIFDWETPVEFDHPAVLCRKLAAGELDAAFVSSFEFLEHPIYQVVDDVAVGADGPVWSVFLVHMGPFAEINEVSLDPASRTAAHLLRCLLAESGSAARIVDDTGEISATRARLMIGDQAIRFRTAHEHEYQFRDLGAWWKETTGLPFVFALWLIRPEVAAAHELANQLRARRDANLRSLDPLIAAEREFSPAFCRHYFADCLRFQFGEREKEGLNKFHSFCVRHGFLPANVAAPLRLV